MDCTRIIDLLPEYLEGTLDGSEKRRVEEHLAGCEGCSAELKLLQRYFQTMAGLDRHEAPAGFLRNVHARIEREPSWKSLLSRLFLPLKIKLPLEALGVAAAALLIFTFYYSAPETKMDLPRESPVARVPGTAEAPMPPGTLAGLPAPAQPPSRAATPVPAPARTEAHPGSKASAPAQDRFAAQPSFPGEERGAGKAKPEAEVPAGAVEAGRAGPVERAATETPAPKTETGPPQRPDRSSAVLPAPSAPAVRRGMSPRVVPDELTLSVELRAAVGGQLSGAVGRASPDAAERADSEVSMRKASPVPQAAPTQEEARGAGRAGAGVGTSEPAKAPASPGAVPGVGHPQPRARAGKPAKSPAAGPPSETLSGTPEELPRSLSQPVDAAAEVSKAVRSSGGVVLAEDIDRKTGRLKTIVAEIPVEGYSAVVSSLERIGSVRKHSGLPPGVGPGGRLRLRIEFSTPPTAR